MNELLQEASKRIFVVLRFNSLHGDSSTVCGNVAKETVHFAAKEDLANDGLGRLFRTTPCTCNNRDGTDSRHWFHAEQKKKESFVQAQAGPSLASPGWPGQTRIGLAWFWLGQPRLTRPGQARPGMARPGQACIRMNKAGIA